VKSKAHHNGELSSWLTIGAFDGVHLGHQRILSLLDQGAACQNCMAYVVTFFPHPAVHLNAIKGNFYLSTPEEQDFLLSKWGADEIITFEFDHDFSRLSPRDFILKLLGRVSFSKLLIGYDFRMGADRAGDHAALKELGKEFGFAVEVVNPVMFENAPISSSRIRAALSSGRVEQANAMLGYAYAVSGEVVHGDGRGRHIGLPTANISPWPMKLIPATGVYAAFTEIDGEAHPSVISIGYRPTFYAGGIPTFETHVLDFSDSIYGKTITAHFIARLRPEEKYDSVDALMAQIKCDIINAEEILSNATKPTRISA